MRQLIDTAQNTLTALVDLLSEVVAADKPRRAPRFRMKVPVRYRWADHDEWFSGVTSNVSRSGILFAPDRADPHLAGKQPLHPGTRLSLTLELPTDSAGQQRRHVRAEAMLVRAAPALAQVPTLGVVVERWRPIG